MIYLLCFGGSLLLAYFATKVTDRRQKILLLIASAALPILLAGLRDYSVGIDVENYYSNLRRYWPKAVSSDSLWAYMKYFISLGRGEPLFALFIGIIAQVTGSFRVFLFMAHAAIVSCVYVGAFRMKKHADPLLVLALFYLLFFSHSLNIIRQYMAMALIFAFLQDIEERKFWRYSMVVVIAALIHSTALLAFGALLVYAVMYADYQVGGYKIGKYTLGKKITPTLKQRQIFIAAALGFAVLIFKPLCQLMIHIGVLSDKYNFYMVSASRSYAGIVTILLVAELMALYVFRRQAKRTDSFMEFFVMCSICYLILQQLTAVIVFGKRIAAYYSLQNLVTIGILDRSFEPYDKRTRWIVRGALITVALGYWWYFYVLRNASETIPYLFG